MKTNPSPQAGTPPQPSPAQVPARDFLLLHLTLLLYSVGSVLGKYAAVNLAAGHTTLVIVFGLLDVASLGLYALLWQQALKRMPLSFAFSNKAVCTLWSCLFGLLFFGESLTWGKAIGILVVLLGVWLVVSDHE